MGLALNLLVMVEDDCGSVIYCHAGELGRMNKPDVGKVN